jgi:hypothetical protein
VFEGVFIGCADDLTGGNGFDAAQLDKEAATNMNPLREYFMGDSAAVDSALRDALRIL